MLTCREVSERADHFVQGELGLWEAVEVRMHLLACRSCRSFVRQMKAVVRLVQKYGYTLPDDDSPQELDPQRLLVEALARRRAAAAVTHSKPNREIPR